MTAYRSLIPYDDMARGCLPLQTKVKIYDNKCSNCGFARIEVIDASGNIMLFKNIEKAISEAQSGGYKGIKEINRTCEYPGNIINSDYGDIYPTLNEIIINTCRLWNKSNHEQCNEIIEELTLVENEQIKIPTG